MIDPMTGEGIHHAMDSGRIAAQFLDEAFKVGNFGKDVMKEYQNRWMNKFGYDFKWLDLSFSPSLSLPLSLPSSLLPSLLLSLPLFLVFSMLWLCR